MPQPQVVLVLPDRATRLLFEYLFSADGWRTHAADTPLDALAAAFNAEADLIVAALADRTGSGAGETLVRALARDEELRDSHCALLVPPDVSAPESDLPHLTVFPFPCDPFRVIATADERLGRETRGGLGRRAFSSSIDDLALHAWGWTLAALDIIRDVPAEIAAQEDAPSAAEAIGRRLGCRIGALVATVVGERPEGDDLAGWKSNGPDIRAWVVRLEDSLWWRIVAPEDEEIPLAAIECIGGVAVAVRSAIGEK